MIFSSSCVYVNLALHISYICNETNVACNDCTLNVLYDEMGSQMPFQDENRGNVAGYMTVYYRALKVFTIQLLEEFVPWI